MENKARGLTMKLIEKEIETNDYIQKLWSELSEEDKQLVEKILGYYRNKLQKKIHKNKKKGLDLNERELHYKVFIKTFFKKFFPAIMWTNTYEGNNYKILQFQNLDKIGYINITITDFDVVNFNTIAIILLSKNLNKPHLEALQGIINEKV